MGNCRHQSFYSSSDFGVVVIFVLPSGVRSVLYILRPALVNHPPLSLEKIVNQIFYLHSIDWWCSGMAYLTTRPIDELYSLSVNFFPHPLLSTIPAKSASSGEIQLTA
jgi:hypothetical protein